MYSSAGDKEKLRKAHYNSDIFFFVIPETSCLFRTTNVNKQLRLHKVAHGKIKREATYPLLCLQNFMA